MEANLLVMTKQTSLYDFGYNFLGPICSQYFQALNTYSREVDTNKLVFLAREGYFFSKVYKELVARDLIKEVSSSYLYVSRTFLFRICIADPQSWRLSLSHSFYGTLDKLLIGRFGFSLSQIEAIFPQSELKVIWQLPFEKEQLAMTFGRVLAQLKSAVIESKIAYMDYLAEQGLLSNGINPLMVDVGYAGTIQKLLTQLLQKDTNGLYFIVTKAGEHTLAGNIATMKGVYKEGVSMGDGYTMLDRSLFLESLLTAPEGQFLDVTKKSEYSESPFHFYFGRKAYTQHNIHELHVVFDGAMEAVCHALKNDIHYTTEEIETLYEKYANNGFMFPMSARPLFDVDDAISGNANVNPLNLFKL